MACSPERVVHEPSRIKARCHLATSALYDRHRMKPKDSPTFNAGFLEIRSIVSSLVFPDHTQAQSGLVAPTICPIIFEQLLASRCYTGINRHGGGSDVPTPQENVRRR